MVGWIFAFISRGAGATRESDGVPERKSLTATSSSITPLLAGYSFNALCFVSNEPQVIRGLEIFRSCLRDQRYFLYYNRWVYYIKAIIALIYRCNTLIIILSTISRKLLVFQERKFLIMATIANSKTIIILTSTPTTPADFVLFAYTTVADYLAKYCVACTKCPCACHVRYISQ